MIQEVFREGRRAIEYMPHENNRQSTRYGMLQGGGGGGKGIGEKRGKDQPNKLCLNVL